MNPIPLGVYRHYKGKEYKVTGFARHSETLEDMVIYQALYGERETWARPLSMWENPVEVGGKTVKRFTFVGEGVRQDPRETFERLRTTAMSTERIRRNLSLEVPDVAAWCREQTGRADCVIQKGKNWYVHAGGAVLTVNAKSHTVITAHPSKLRTREMTAADYPLLAEFLYHAVFVPPGENPPPREITREPDVFRYMDGFGEKRGDCGAVVEYGGETVGAAWTRIIPAYGYIDDDTPELAVSVLPAFRGRGAGTLLMTCLFGLLRSRGFLRTSLAVQKRNAAVRFYERLGYETVGESDTERIMRKELGKEDG